MVAQKETNIYGAGVKQFINLAFEILVFIIDRYYKRGIRSEDHFLWRGRKSCVASL